MGPLGTANDRRRRPWDSLGGPNGRPTYVGAGLGEGRRYWAPGPRPPTGVDGPGAAHWLEEWPEQHELLEVTLSAAFPGDSSA